MRHYQLFTPPVFQQKLNYIHKNPVRARLCKFVEDYRYSSARFYETGVDDPIAIGLGILTHWNGELNVGNELNLLRAGGCINVAPLARTPDGP